MPGYTGLRSNTEVIYERSKNMTTEKLSFKERLGYGLGTAGEQFPNFLVQTFLFAS